MNAHVIRPGGRRQGGAALFIALIALVFMMLAGVAMVRSVDTSNLIAGNLSFKQATLNISDVAAEMAFARLNATYIPTSRDANYPSGCSATSTPSCEYFALQQAEDATGVPSTIDWTKVKCFYVGSSAPSGCPTGSLTVSAVPTGYVLQFVVDRLCSGTLPITDIQTKCYSGAPSTGGTKKAGGVTFSSSQEVFYRTTVRVTGPRGTSSLIQTIFAR